MIRGLRLVREVLWPNSLFFGFDLKHHWTVESLRSDMSSQINELANEILHIIFSNTGPDSLQNCRLVCRRWRKIGDEHFLPTIFTNTITKLELVAKNVVVAGHVRSIIFTKKASEEWPNQINASTRLVQAHTSLGDGDMSLANVLDCFPKWKNSLFRTGDLFNRFMNTGHVTTLQTLRPTQHRFRSLGSQSPTPLYNERNYVLNGWTQRFLILELQM
jgi:hypothetical protein